MSIELMPEKELWHLELVPEEDIKRRNRRNNTKKIIIEDDKNNSKMLSNGEYSIFSKYVRYIINKKDGSRKNNGSRKESDSRKINHNSRKIDIIREVKKRIRMDIRKKRIGLQYSKFRKNIFSIKDWAWAVVGENSEDILREIYDENVIKKARLIDVLKLMGYLCEKNRFVIQRNYGIEKRIIEKRIIENVNIKVGNDNNNSDNNGDNGDDDECVECVYSFHRNISVIGSFWRSDEYFFVINGKQYSCRPLRKAICRYRKKEENRIMKEIKKEIIEWYATYFR